MAGVAEKLGVADDALLLAVFDHRTLAEAAAAVGISERTVYRRVAEPAFQHRLEEMRRRRLEWAMRELQSTAEQATECLRRNLSCGVPSVEVRAAGLILDFGLRATELLDLAERVAGLEDVMGVKRDAERR